MKWHQSKNKPEILQKYLAQILIQYTSMKRHDTKTANYPLEILKTSLSIELAKI